jgi:hypothetical protein
MAKFSITETFTTRLLGSAPANKEVYREYIAKKKAEAEEKRRKHAERTGTPSVPPVGTVEEEVETINEEIGLTVFHNDLGETTESGEPGRGLFLFDYQVCGFWKEAAEILVEEHGIRQPRSKLDNYLLIEPRRIYIRDEDGKVLTKADLRIERPLRAMTMQGPRVSLACSEVVNPGRTVSYTADFLPYLKRGTGKDAKPVDLDKFVESIVAFAQRKGRGQWRNGGNGKFRAVVKPLEISAQA